VKRPTATRHRRLMMANNVSSALAFLNDGVLFSAPLLNAVTLQQGYGAPSFTRVDATPRATVVDWEGVLRTALTGEVRFTGARRVRNLIPNSESVNSSTKSAAGTGTNPTVTDNYATAPDGTTTAARVQFNVGVGRTGGDSSAISFITASGIAVAVASVYLKSNDGITHTMRLRAGTSGTPVSVSVGGSWVRFSDIQTAPTFSALQITQQGNIDGYDTADILVWHPQVEDVSGQSNQNPAEYVSVGPTSWPNYLTNSENITVTGAAGWNNVDVTLTANYAACSDGRVIATRVVEGAALTAVVQQTTAATVPDGSRVTTYYEVKRNAVNDWVFVRTADNTAVNGLRTWFNLATGTKGSDVLFGTATSAASTMADLGNGWYRLTCTCTFPAGVTTARVAIASSTGDGNTTRVSGSDYSMSRCGLVVGNPVSYSPVGNVLPYHGAMVDGVKYFSTQNGNTVASNVVTEATGAAIPVGTLRGYRKEPASTNLDLYSQLASDAAWGKTDTTVTSENNLAPDGTLTAALLTDGVAGTANIGNAVGRTITSGGFCTASRYFRRGNTDWVQITVADIATGTERIRGWFNLATGVVGTTAVAGTASDAAVYMDTLAGGWYRCTLLGKINGGVTSVFVGDFCVTADASNTRVNNATRYWWGAQFENRMGATSYIPTTVASVLRATDLLSYPAQGNVSEQDGSGVARGYYNTPTGAVEFGRFWSTTNGGTSSISAGVVQTNNRGYGNVTVVGADQGNPGSGVANTVSNTTGPDTICFTWKENDMRWFHDGVYFAQDVVATMNTAGSMTTIFIGDAGNAPTTFFNGDISNIKFYNHAFTDAEGVAASR